MENVTFMGREWFSIDIKTAIAAVEAVKKGMQSLGNKRIEKSTEPIIFRPEQEEAIRSHAWHTKSRSIK